MNDKKPVLKLPFTVAVMTEEEIERRRATGFRKHAKMARVTPGSLTLPPAYKLLAETIYNMKLRPDDIVLMSYPKSGTVWMKEILWAMRNTDNLTLAEELSIYDRDFGIARDLLFPKDSMTEAGYYVEKLAQLPPTRRRCYNTHLYFCLLPPQLLDTCKVVYVMRNPKDVCFSIKNHFCNLGILDHNCSLETCTQLLMDKELVFGDYWDHVLAAWQRRDHPNLHIVHYEDLKSDLMTEMTKLNEFLDLQLTQDQLNKVWNHVQLDQMKAREKKLPISVYDKEGTFFPTGKSGGWTSAAPQHLNDLMDEWIAKNSEGTDIIIKFK